ncbi:hypothetical protein [Streptomyces sp. NPDC003720]|uniref:hypothetical protein n=1 Tax=Streptomyces sp. NPDC003720 TaxID=3364684 RepID=UPI0036D096B2
MTSFSNEEGVSAVTLSIEEFGAIIQLVYQGFEFSDDRLSEIGLSFTVVSAMRGFAREARRLVGGGVTRVLVVVDREMAEGAPPVLDVMNESGTLAIRISKSFGIIWLRLIDLALGGSSRRELLLRTGYEHDDLARAANLLMAIPELR